MKNLATLFIIAVASLCSCSNDDGINLPTPNPEDFLGEIDFVTTFGGSQNENYYICCSGQRWRLCFNGHHR